jgi:outer membrane protein assembly factor BamB
VLHAIDPRTGRDLWARELQQRGWLGAYDGGRLIVATEGNSPDSVLAYAASDGHLLWRHDFPTGSTYPAAPVATRGAVYVSFGEAVQALRGADGTTLWTAYGNGTSNVPAVADGRVIMTYACAQTFGFSADQGTKLWHHDSRCSGGGGWVPSVSGNRVYVAEEGLTLDAATGNVVGSHVGIERSNPVLARGIGVFARGTKGIAAFDLATGKQRWSHPARADDLTFSSPVGVYHAVYAATKDGSVHAFGLESGKRQWAGRAGSEFKDSPGALALAPGLLLVAAGNKLVAYDSLFRPKPEGIDLGADSFDVEYGVRNAVGGLLGTSLRTARRRVTLQWDEPPYGRWRKLATGGVDIDGWSAFNVRTEKNTRFRAVTPGGHVSDVVTVYTYPRFRIKVSRGKGRAINHIQGAVRLTVARGTRLGGRRVFLYLNRVHRHYMSRLGSARLGATGPGRTRAVVPFHALSTFSNDDYFVVCVPRQWRLGLGRHDKTAARCGRKRIRL